MAIHEQSIDPHRRRVAVQSVGLFVGTRVLLLIAVTAIAKAHHTDVLRQLTRLDGGWYMGIAKHGYSAVAAVTSNAPAHVNSNAAFFALYPLTIRLFAWAVGYPVAALLASFLAGCLASWFMALWAYRRFGSRPALATVGIWALWPSSAVLSMAYSEALFTATVAGALLAMQRQRWGWAAVACLLAGLTRPSALALLLALAVGLWDAEIRRSLKFLWLVVGGAGLAGSVAYVAYLTHRIDGWLWIERSWNSGMDFGLSSMNRMIQVLTLGRAAHVAPDVVATIVVLACALFLVLLWRDGVTPLRERVFAAALFLMTFVGANYFHCKPRFLLPNLPLFTVPARWWAERGVVLRWSCVLSMVLASTAWNAYLIAVWPISV
jgi:uncharacterized membrane protein YiaA